MPKVKKGESRNKYVSRAIPVIKQENPNLSQGQAVGKAEGMFTNRYGLKKTKQKKAINI